MMTFGFVAFRDQVSQRMLKILLWYLFKTVKNLDLEIPQSTGTFICDMQPHFTHRYAINALQMYLNGLSVFEPLKFYCTMV